MKYFITTVSLCAALAAHSSPTLAATPEQLQQAQALLSAEQPDQALGLLEAAHDPATASTQEFFLLGVAAKQAGQLSRSEGYFRSALQREPNAGRIRLELAEVLFRQGKLDDSRAELVTVRAMNPPEQVRQNIDGFIAQVDQARANPNAGPRGPQKNWNAYITVGFTSDSNVNAGPDSDTVFLYGLPFTLSSAAQETQDTALFFAQVLVTRSSSTMVLFGVAALTSASPTTSKLTPITRLAFQFRAVRASNSATS